MANNLSNNSLFEKIAGLIESSRKQVASAVNLTMVYTYFEIGKMIIEDEQAGNLRAAYAKSVLKDLSVKLSEKFGKGFSERNLRNMRQFYIAYAQTEIQQKPSAESQDTKNEAAIIWQKPSAKLPKFVLGWSYQIILMGINNINPWKVFVIQNNLKGLGYE
jgi:hypothetical protein